MGEASYHDLLKKRLLNMPLVAWAVIAFAVATALVAFAKDFMPLLDRWTTSQRSGLHITVSPMDPRFATQDGLMNWGGGSQAIFFTLSEQCDARSAAAECTEVPRDYDKDDVEQVWEAPLFGEAVVLVNAIYDGPKESGTCSVLRWGIEALSVQAPQDVVLAGYAVGGASGAYEGAATPVINGPGTYPLISWFEKDEQIKRPEKYTLLAPGKTTALKVHVQTAPRGAKARQALRLVVFADVLIDGKRRIVKSSEQVQMLVPSTTDVRSQLRKVEATAGQRSRWDFIENLRTRAYLPLEQ